MNRSRIAAVAAGLAVVGLPLISATAAHAEGDTSSPDTAQTSPSTGPSSTTPSTADPASSTTPPSTTGGPSSGSSDTEGTVTPGTSSASSSPSGTSTTVTPTSSPSATSTSRPHTSGGTGSSDHHAPKPFEKYEATLTWYGPSPDTTDNPFAVPQTLTAIDCGGIVQVDHYWITSRRMQADFDRLKASGVLTSSAGDAEFSPHDYTVTALPACVIVPPKPADDVKSTVTHDIVCTADDQFYYTTTTTITTPYVYDETTNTWILGTPGTPVVDTTKRAATGAECPPVVVTPPTPPVTTPPVVTPPPVVVTPPSTPVTPTVPVKVPPTPVVRTAAAPAPTATPTASGLAYTGSDDTVQGLEIGGGILALGGIALAIARRRRA